MDTPDYAELHAVSNFTFLRGASHPEELVERADELGYRALALTDECSLAGIVRAHVAARDRPLKLVIGSEVALADGPRLVLLATDRAAYGDLVALLTRGRRAAPKGRYRLTRADLEAEPLHGCLALWLPAPAADAGEGAWLKERFGADAWIAVELLAGGRDRERLRLLEALGRRLGLDRVASGDVHLHRRERQRLQDVLTAVRLGLTVETAGLALYPNRERYLKTRADLRRRYPAALLAATLAIAERASFSLEELRYEYPEELVPAGHTPASWLARLTGQGLARRFPGGAPAAVRALVERELTLIAELGYEPFFLTVEDLVAFARGRGILCQGRGSAANSAVCYCLGITEVDPSRMSLLFERFVSKERNEPPDIDVDFEHERREEVIQYLYAKYGRHRAALAATVISYRPRSALRDVGKALGLDALTVERLARSMQWWDGNRIEDGRVREAGLDPDNPTLRLALGLARELIGFPRHLSQHVGGFVIARRSLAELVPVENAAMADRTVIEWDKDDLDDLGLLKVDVLGLGMLTAIRRALELVSRRRGRPFTMADVPAEDPATYAMISRADTIGVFQIESRAQMAMLPRLKPRNYYDLVIEVAIIRPGPIQGDMVHPYLRRRNGEEPVSYPSAEVQGVLERTLGVPIFQEQVMQLAVVAAGFTPGEADRLRRAMAAWKRRGGLGPFEARLIDGMRARGYAESFARAIFNQILGFGEYGFPECVVGETRVVDADTGSWITIDDVVLGRAPLKATLACDAQLRLQTRTVLAVKPSGVKPVFRLTTALGHSIVATAEHPFLTIDGWRKLGELKVGDRVAAARILPVRGRRRWPRHRILVLADLIAEGNRCGPNTIYFHTTAPWHCDDFVSAVERFPNTRAVVGRNRGRFSVRVRRIDRTLPVGAVAWAKNLDIWGCGVRDQRLPAGVFELCDANIALLLGRLWEGDGGFSMRGGASYDTASARLAAQIQHLLLRLGIVARLCRRIRLYRERRLERHIVTVTGGEPLRRFSNRLGRHFLDPKKRRLSEMLATRGQDRIANVLESKSPERLANSDVCWDEVVAIEARGREPTYDLTIEGDRNFLANNLVVHNSHSASFALLVYVSAWLKCHEPAAFTAALLNSQPMGFYAPAQLVRDAREHDVALCAVDVNASELDATLEGEPPALRLGLRQVRGLSAGGAERLVAARRTGRFDSAQDLAERACLDRRDLGALAASGALAALAGHRHRAAWDVGGVVAPTPLFATTRIAEGAPLLRAPREGEDIVADYRSLGLTLGRHPLALLRARLEARGLLTAACLRELPHGARARACGLVLVRQRPGSASGVTFVTLEDETGVVNLVVWQNVAERWRRPLLESRLLEAGGEVQREGEVLHLIVARLVDHSPLLGSLLVASRDFH